MRLIRFGGRGLGCWSFTRAVLPVYSWALLGLQQLGRLVRGHRSASYQAMCIQLCSSTCSNMKIPNSCCAKSSRAESFPRSAVSSSLSLPLLRPFSIFRTTYRRGQLRLSGQNSQRGESRSGVSQHYRE